jgi:hypothetical protein
MRPTPARFLRMNPTYQYRLTKYDPAQRDDRGAFQGDDWTGISDIGETFSGARLDLATYLDVEARHLSLLAAFIEESEVSELVAEGVENASKQFRVVEGDRLSSIAAIEAVRQMLREEGWCRLVDRDRFFIHVGWDYYIYVGSDRACIRSVEMAERLGLFVDREFKSPYLEEA